MIGELVCPDCGGVVGAVEATEAGPPCRCFADASSSANSASMTGTLTGAAVSRLDPPGDGAAADAVVPAPATVVIKVCRTCGTDLNGHRRYRDSLGYLCTACHDEEQKQEHYGRVRCGVCGHLVKEEKLADYEGTLMCPNCHGERTDLRRQEIKRIGFKGARVRDELRQVYILLAVGGALLLVIVVGVLINHFRH